jgi:multiple sugar transport system ATP-binding protein
MVFQSYALYPQMTVAENMAFSLKLGKIPKAEVQAKVEKASSILGLSPLLDRYPRQLSGGQRQRVAMGRAIVRDPAVFLFDEPLSNLDAKLRVAMRTEIKALHQRLKTTTIYVTHDQIEAMTMADTIVVMKDGRIEQTGRPLDLYDTPANLFVAQFIGSPSMNVLHGTAGPGGFKCGENSTLPLAVTHQPRAAIPAIYGVRPEHLSLSSAGSAASFPVTVDVIEPTGAETQIFARFGELPIVAVVRERIDTRPGDQLFVQPDLSKVHLFTADGSQRL